MVATKNRGLGRGLDAIFGTTTPTQQSKPMTEMAEVALSAIEPNPLQPRTMFDDEALQELSASIAQLGVIQPITLKPNGKDKYIIISGERRWRASQLAGLETIPAYIREVDDENLHAMALVENIQRENLNAIEIALGMKRLIEECGLTQEAMAEKVGKKRSTVSNYMRLLSMPSEVQLALKDGIISMGHAKAIGGLDLDLQLKALKKCVKKSLSVRQAEELARKMAETTTTTKESEDEEYPESYSRLVMELERIISDNISIKRTKSGSSRITIECSNDAEVEKLIAKLSKIK
ncbi:MAG: ParB/RepB/Spo0J family partition protein [Alistipes sp.]|nr:ParB/RepB/Spo0J family partition protein [Alistipes sp.]